jgi:hypothetical protein
MAQLRRKYISDEFVIVNNYETDFNDGNSNQECIYCPGNEHLTKPAVLALVQREGMMQRLADSEDSYIGDWCVRVVESNEPLCSISTMNLILASHSLVSLHMDTTIYLLLLGSTVNHHL